MKTLFLKTCLALILAGVFPATNVALRAQITLPWLHVTKVPLPEGGFRIILAVVNYEGTAFGTYSIHSLHIVLNPGKHAFQTPMQPVPESTPGWAPLDEDHDQFGLDKTGREFGLTAKADIRPGFGGAYILAYNVDPGADFDPTLTTFQFDEADHPDVYRAFDHVEFSQLDLDGTNISATPFGLPVLEQDGSLPVPEPATYGPVAALLLGVLVIPRWMRGAHPVTRRGAFPLSGRP